MRKTEGTEENFNVYTINSTAIVFIINEFCVALLAATAGLLNISSFFGYIPFIKEVYTFQHVGTVVGCEATNLIALNTIAPACIAKKNVREVAERKTVIICHNQS